MALPLPNPNTADPPLANGYLFNDGVHIWEYVILRESPLMFLWRKYTTSNTAIQNAVISSLFTNSQISNTITSNTIYSNVFVTNVITINNSLNVNGIFYANSSLGTEYQVLTSNSLGGVYWSAAASVGTGYSGSLGYSGSIGYVGSQGTNGLDGYTGSRGYDGSVGYTGSQGYLGSFGYAGSVGYSGSQGNDGSVGYTGSQGYLGSFGYTGSQGYDGSVGYTGSQGYLGSFGYAGSRGNQGEIGFTGSSGFTGSQGYDGSVGYVGSQGYFGSFGYTGSTGASVAPSSSPPASPTYGTLWFSPETGGLSFYYEPEGVWLGIGEGTGYTGSSGFDPLTAYTFSNTITFKQTAQSINVINGATSTIEHNYSNSVVFYHTNMSSNFTANFINIPTTNQRITPVTLLLNQGVAGYYANSIQIEGVSQTIKWLSNTIPTAQSNVLEKQLIEFIRVQDNWLITSELISYA